MNNLLIEGHPPLLDEQHQRRRRGHDLGQRGEIPECTVDTHGRTRGVPCEPAVALREQDRVVSPDDEHGAGIDTLVDPGRHQWVECGGIKPARLGPSFQSTQYRKQKQQSYDQMPGIRRLQEGQRPSAPMRCCLMTYPYRSISMSPQSGQYVFSQRPTRPGKFPAYTNRNPARAPISHARSSVAAGVLSGSVIL